LKRFTLIKICSGAAVSDKVERMAADIKTALVSRGAENIAEEPLLGSWLDEALLRHFSDRPKDGHVLIVTYDDVWRSPKPLDPTRIFRIPKHIHVCFILQSGTEKPEAAEYIGMTAKAESYSESFKNFSYFILTPGDTIGARRLVESFL
jgi:hypothetical protein